MKASFRFLLLFSALLLVTGSLMAQGTTGALNGTIVHEGAPLPGVTITIESPALQGARVAVSNVNGDFNFPALPPGQYIVKFEMEGMATVTNTIRIGLARTERVNADMRLSALAEQITVTAAAPAVLETTEVQSNYESELVQNLPVARGFQQIAMLAPGVSNNGPSGSQTGEDGNIDAIVISGAFAYDSLYLVNGAVTNENLRGQSEDLFIEDAIQETTVITGAISAEYGRFTGGVVSAITKSGGNEFTGSFRDSLTNPAWSAASDFGEDKADSTLNETYEATLGGRVVRDRLWFFGAGRFVEQQFQSFFFNSATEREGTVQTDERYEVKLTGQITPKHSLVASYLNYLVDQTPTCGFGCWDINTVDLNGRQMPREMNTVSYNGILTSNLLVEAAYSDRYISWEDSGSEHRMSDYTDPRDIALGSWGYDQTYGGIWGDVIFRSDSAETRENQNVTLKGTYYLATAGIGTHNVVAGYENFAESRTSNNYQSASNLDVYIWSGIAPTRVGDHASPTALRPVIREGDWLNYFPIDNLSLGSDFVTESLFINDKWDLTAKWSFNIGVRYDKNDGRDSSLNKISDDSNISPRLGIIYDINGDGRFRANASYSRYVARIQESVGGNNGGGNPSYYRYEYTGPQIGGPDSGLSSFDVLEQAWAWLLAEGWSPATPTAPATLFGVGIPGFNQRYPGDLKSPATDEFTLGFGMQIGQKGFARLDYVDRNWTDFYTTSTTPGDTITGLPGTFDMITYGNCTSCLERTYKGLSVQAAYRFSDRFSMGGNYTWSETKGNFDGETRGNGPGASTSLQYTEYHEDSWNQPVGLLLSDSTHKMRLWLGYDLPLGAFGNLNFSLLERFDSGTPYSAVTNVNTRNYVDCHPCGYETPTTTWPYYFSDRGEYRWDDTTSTDIAVNYEVPIWRVNLFVQGELINAFNEQAVTRGSAGITTAGMQRFDPFNETPVEGVHWAKRSTFGQATGAGSYQLPRTYRLSFGLRF